MTRIGKFFEHTGRTVVGDVTLQTPTTGYTTADLTPDFNWTDATNATSYRIQIATDAGFVTIVETGTPATSNYTSSGLTAGQTYYWRARGENGTVYGNWAAAFTLKTLGTVTLDTPADASFTTDTTPTFNWNAATNATGYVMELATDSGFSTIIQTYSGANTTYTATTIATDGWLYWRVRPTAEAGAEVGSNTATRTLELFNNRYCVVFDGSNDYASKSGISVWRNQSKWEFCGNIQVDDKSANMILFTAYYDTSNRISIIIVDNAATSQFKVRANVNTSTQYIESGLLDYGTKYFVYFGFDGTQSAGSRYLLYINNVSNGTITGTEPTAVGNAGNFTFYVGSSNTGTTFNYDGKIDHWAVRYNRTLLTSAERGNAYNSGNMRRYQDVATFDSIWDMNENTGTTMNDDGADNLDITFAGSPSTPTWGTW